MFEKNVLVSLVEIPKPMVTLKAANQILDIEPRRFGNSTRWRNDAVTMPQLNRLQTLGVYPTQRDAQTFTKGRVSDIIDALINNERQRERLEYHLALAGGIKHIGA